MSGWIVGLDLGQARDFTALAVLERVQGEGRPAEYRVRHLERPPRGSSYPRVAARARELLEHPELRGASLVVDATGVGRPVVDLLREHALDPVAVTITAGDAPGGSGSDLRVPKRDLVATLQVLLATGRLRVAASLPLARTLERELLAFRARVTPAGHDAYETGEAEHDDLVLAVALACWWGERQGGELQVFL